MKEYNSVEALLGVIADILKVIPLHQGSITQNITPETLNELEKLEAAMAKFEELNKATFQNANIEIDKLRRETLDSDKITPKQKQLLKKSQEIEKEARNLQAQYAYIVAQSKGKMPTARTESQKKTIKDRRNRYKPIGGDKKWIPI